MGIPKRLGILFILKKGFEVYVKRFKDILFATLIFYTPIALLDFFPIKVDFEAFGFAHNIMSFFPEEYADFLDLNLLAEFALAYLIGTFLAPLGMMAVTHISYNALEEKECGFKQAAELSFKSWGKFIVTSFFKTLISIFSFFALAVLTALGGINATMIPIIPVLIFAVCFAFSDYCVIIESKWGLAALVRSTQLVMSNKNWLWVIGYTLVLFSIEFSIMLLMGGVIFFGSLFAYCLAATVVCAQCCWFHNVKQIADAQMNQQDEL